MVFFLRVETVLVASFAFFILQAFAEAGYRLLMEALERLAVVLTQFFGAGKIYHGLS